ncbi:MAG: hypothetical protein ACYSUM_21140 [Planctomycetota bacterium]|jgi:hypothetical protein
MKRSETLYVLAVAVFAVALTAIALAETAKVIARGPGDATFSPTAGEPRDLDLEQIKRLLRSRDLSDREALHYERLEDD